MGGETGTLSDFDADNFDLHQGYIEINHGGDRGFDLRVGRQEVTLGGERLVGPVGWTQQAQAFDGLSARYVWPKGSVNLLGFKTGEATSAAVDEDSEFTGAYAQFQGIADGNLEVYGFFRRDLGPAVDPPQDTKEASFGARLVGRRDKIQFRVEGTYQFGDRDGMDVRAFMVGARIGAVVSDRVTLTAWYDYLSGDNDQTDTTVRVFNTLFGTNHKFYGYADFFLNIPVHTGGLGLQDLAIKGAFRPLDDVSVGIDLHKFLFARQGTMSSSRIGEEIDVTVSHRYSRNLSVQAGYSYIVQGDGFRDLGRLTENGQWAYLMLNASF